MPVFAASSLSLLLAFAVLPARAQLTDRNRRRRRHHDPHRDRPVRERGQLAARHHAASSAPISAQRPLPAGERRRHRAAPHPRRGRAARRFPRARRRRRRRRVDAPARRRPRRGALRAARRRQADAAGVDDVHRHAGAVPRHRAQDRRRHLREAHRRSRRVLDAHRVHHEAGRPLRAASSPMPTAAIRRRSSASNEPLLSPAWSPDGSRIAYVSLENKKPVVYVQSMATGQRQVRREFPRQQQRARVVAGRPPPRGHAHQGRRLADLTDQRRRRRRRTRAVVSGGIDTEASFTPDGARAAVHLRSRRHAADLPADARRRAPIERMTFEGGTTCRRAPRPTARASCSCAARAAAS